MLVSKPCSEATNIGDRLSLLADCRCWYKIRIGNFDNVGECQYAVPSYWDIGKVYKRLIKQVALEKKIDVVDAIIEAYHSFISDKIDDYNSSVYYENPSYIFECFIQNKIL